MKTELTDQGPDLNFAARVREHQHLVRAADERLRQARKKVEESGGISSEINEYAKALSEKSALDVQGYWYIAADSTLSNEQKDAIASVQENIAKGGINNLDNSGSTST